MQDFKTKNKMNLLLILLSVSLNCAAQLLIRKGMMTVGEVNASNMLQMLVPMVSNVFLWLAMACYGLSFFLWLIVLSRVEVSYATPFLSVGYVLVAVAGHYLFGEQVSLMRIVGIVVICVGVFVLARS